MSDKPCALCCRRASDMLSEDRCLPCELDARIAALREVVTLQGATLTLKHISYHAPTSTFYIDGKEGQFATAQAAVFAMCGISRDLACQAGLEGEIAS